MREIFSNRSPRTHGLRGRPTQSNKTHNTTPLPILRTALRCPTKTLLYWVGYIPLDTAITTLGPRLGLVTFEALADAALTSSRSEFPRGTAATPPARETRGLFSSLAQGGHGHQHQHYHHHPNYRCRRCCGNARGLSSRAQSSSTPLPLPARPRPRHPAPVATTVRGERSWCSRTAPRSRS